jgi:GDPmannose 4,6-dehydratase
MKTAFITGITGQDGSYLAEFLLAKGYSVVGLVSQKHDIGGQNIASFQSKLILEVGDLLDKASLALIIKKHRPSEVYNLGGVTFVPASWEKPVLTNDVNALGPLRILEIIRDDFPQVRFYQATTAKIFGDPAQSPQTEETPVAPQDPYSVSKTCAHFLTQVFRRQFGLFACSGILYNHESERRGPEFVTRKITQGAVKIKLGLEESLTLGNLKAKQDWGYAPDYVEAMWLMLQQEKADDYVVATGELHTVEDVCRVAFGVLGLDYQKYVTVDKTFFRKTEARALTGDAGKAKRILGWQPRTSFESMIEKMVHYDLQLLQ